MKAKFIPPSKTVPPCTANKNKWEINVHIMLQMCRKRKPERV